MANVTGPVTLAAVGTTGNNTHTSVYVGGIPDSCYINFKVEAVGATPTVTTKVQVSMDNSIWTDVPVYTSAVGAGVASITVTAAGDSALWVDMGGQSRFFRYVRVVTTANTNVTYSATSYVVDNAG